MAFAIDEGRHRGGFLGSEGPVHERFFARMSDKPCVECTLLPILDHQDGSTEDQMKQVQVLVAENYDDDDSKCIEEIGKVMSTAAENDILQKCNDDIASVLVSTVAVAAAAIAQSRPAELSQAARDLVATEQEISNRKHDRLMEDRQSFITDEALRMLERSASKSPTRAKGQVSYNKRLQDRQQYLASWQRAQNPRGTSSPRRLSPPSNRKGSAASPVVRQLPNVEKREQIVRLQEENKTLATEVKELCNDKSHLENRVSKLEEDLSLVMTKSHVLVDENCDLNTLVQNTQIEITVRESMLTKLLKDKCLLQSEKRSLEDDKSHFESQLMDMNKKVRETSKRADEAEAAVASVVQQIDTLNRNLIKLSKAEVNPTVEMQEIVKQLELHSIQTCKEILKKELKKLTATVNRSKEEAEEAKAIIQNLKQEETRHRADMVEMEKALRASQEHATRLEKQEKLLKSNIELFEARVKSLEKEVTSVRAERDAALKEKMYKEAAAGGLDGVKASIQILQENTKRCQEEVMAVNQQMLQLVQNKEQSSQAGKKLEETASELAASSATVASAAESKLVRLKHQVDALDLALEEAKGAAEESEHSAWETVAELSTEDQPETENESPTPSKLDLPAATTYLIGLGLLLYSVYMSNHS